MHFFVILVWRENQCWRDVGVRVSSWTQRQLAPVVFRMQHVLGTARRPHLLLQGRKHLLRASPRRDAQTSLLRMR